MFLHAADDEIATKENVLDIMRLFEVAKKKRIFIDPNQIGLDTLGHVDLFRARNQSVWPLLLAQIKEGGRIGAIFMEGALGSARVGYKIDGVITWRFVFNATAPVLPGFTAKRGFTL